MRITAALANLLESTFQTRDTLRSELKHIYRLRSTLVHGGKANADKVKPAANFAIEIAARAVLALYERGKFWLAAEAGERSEWLLLGRWAEADDA